jgi:TctA family transporter
MEEYMRRALLLSRGDPMVFLQRPISVTLLAIGVLAVIVASLPALTKKREEAFQGD